MLGLVSVIRIDMKYPSWQAVFLAFFSMDFYKDVAKNWKGLAFLYLFLLLLGSWIISAVRLQIGLNQFIAEDASFFSAQLPAVKVNQGELSIDKLVPYYIKDKTGTVVVVFDTSELSKIKHPSTGAKLFSNPDADLPQVNSDTPLIIVARKMIFFHDGQKTNPMDLSKFDNMQVDSDKVNGFLHFLKMWLGPIVVLVMVPMGWIFCAIQSLIYAAFGTLFAKLKKTSLGFDQLVRLSIIAITPPLIVDTIMRILAVPVPLFWGPLAFLVSMSYIFLAVGVTAEPTEPTPAV